tara:strand:+ start:223 stop:546 length:324 start_codon:yes stop_codon:yes gene_type:complete
VLQEKGKGGARLPSLELREKDVDYQRYRVKIFRDLLKDLPKSRREILRQARLDIPPVLRGEVWAIVLDIDEKNAQCIYDAIDKDSEGRSPRTNVFLAYIHCDICIYI